VILFYGWDSHEWERSQKEIQELLGDEFTTIFLNYARHALEALALANFEENDPISIIVFSRDALDTESVICKVIAGLAEVYCNNNKIKLTTVNVIRNDYDKEIINNAVGSLFAKNGNWKNVFEVVRKNI